MPPYTHNIEQCQHSEIAKGSAYASLSPPPTRTHTHTGPSAICPAVYLTAQHCVEITLQRLVVLLL